MTLTPATQMLNCFCHSFGNKNQWDCLSAFAFDKAGVCLVLPMLSLSYFKTSNESRMSQLETLQLVCFLLSFFFFCFICSLLSHSSHSSLFLVLLSLFFFSLCISGVLLRGICNKLQLGTNYFQTSPRKWAWQHGAPPLPRWVIGFHLLSIKQKPPHCLKLQLTSC